MGRRGPDSLTRERGPSVGRTLFSHPRLLESSPTLPTGWSFGWQLGSYLFFFLMYKTCKRKSSIKWLGTESLISQQDRGHPEADDPHVLRGFPPRNTHPAFVPPFDIYQLLTVPGLQGGEQARARGAQPGKTTRSGLACRQEDSISANTDCGSSHSAPASDSSGLKAEGRFQHTLSSQLPPGSAWLPRSHGWARRTRDRQVVARLCRVVALGKAQGWASEVSMGG